MVFDFLDKISLVRTVWNKKCKNLRCPLLRFYDPTILILVARPTVASIYVDACLGMPYHTFTKVKFAWVYTTAGLFLS